MYYGSVDVLKKSFRCCLWYCLNLTLLNLDEKDYANWSYLDLADQMRRWITNPTDDLNQLFKRIAFNGLVSNTDDHPRNHGFVHNGNSYRLSPVYDLVPTPETGTTRYLAMHLAIKVEPSVLKI